MNEILNLVEILKDAPKGTKLWSPVCGECTFLYIAAEKKGYYHTINCETADKYGTKENVVFTEYGVFYSDYAYGECVLFPSKENRDWSTFKVPKQHKHFEPYQKVLCKVGDYHDGEVWTADIYSHYDEREELHYAIGGYGANDDEIIPYEGNEDKLGKTVEK